MKKIFASIFACSALLVAISCQAQDKSKRPSPPATVTQTLESGAVININYSQPSVKGRTIGKDLEPMAGKVWRTGANEATVFETSKDLAVEGGTLPAGKYGLFTIMNDNEWTIIFNKTWDQWGAMKYNEADDVLRVKVKSKKAKTFAEKFSITADANGLITLWWGDNQVAFNVK